MGGIRICLDGLPVLEVRNSEVIASVSHDLRFCYALAQRLGFPAEAFRYPSQEVQNIAHPTALEPEFGITDLDSTMTDGASDGAVSEPEEPSDDAYDNDDFSP
jgi:hypothetical protein